MPFLPQFSCPKLYVVFMQVFWPTLYTLRWLQPFSTYNIRQVFHNIYISVNHLLLNHLTPIRHFQFNQNSSKAKERPERFILG